MHSRLVELYKYFIEEQFKIELDKINNKHGRGFENKRIKNRRPKYTPEDL